MHARLSFTEPEAGVTDTIVGFGIALTAQLYFWRWRVWCCWRSLHLGGNKVWSALSWYNNVGTGTSHLENVGAAVAKLSAMQVQRDTVGSTLASAYDAEVAST